MNCYNFELNISSYIDGEMKYLIREKFNQHKNTCIECSNKLSDIANLLDNMPKLNNITTSDQFEQNLKHKIAIYNSKGPSIWDRLLEFKPLGYRPLPAMGILAALFLLISSSYYLVYEDSLPDFNYNNLSNNSKNLNSSSPRSTIVNPKQQQSAIAISDSVEDSNIKLRNNSIRLVGGK